MEEQKKNSGVMIGTIVALIVAIGAYGFFKYTKNDSVNNIELVTTNPTTPVTPPPALPAYIYKDGQYSSLGKYNSPAGAEEINVKVTLKDDVVTEVVVEPKSKNQTSLKIQTNVSSNVSPFVVGKKLNEIKLDKVSGSSLTPKGFNDAIEKIKTLAKA